MKLAAITYDDRRGQSTAMLEGETGRDGPRIMVTVPGGPLTPKALKILLKQAEASIRL